ncbi:hypothetical protein DXG01_012537 [Tephrocybe rancida]|nr:hypothetical protein DXG01_012537 [Tephrocybe rancida]
MSVLNTLELRQPYYSYLSFQINMAVAAYYGTYYISNIAAINSEVVDVDNWYSPNVYTGLYLAYTSRGLTVDTTTQVFDWFIEQQDQGLMSVSHRDDGIILVAVEEYEAIFCDFDYYADIFGESKYWKLDSVGAR